MARWIHEFRSSGERALTEEERLALRNRAFRLTIRRWFYGGLAVLAFMSAFVPAMMAVTGVPWVGPLFLPFVVLGFYALSWSNGAEKLVLLHRRALRIGLVEEFRRVQGDETARRAWARDVRFEEKDEEHQEGQDDPAETFAPPATGYWAVDERFEENLRRTARGEVRTFEAVGRDGAVLWIEGRLVHKVIEPPVWEVL